MENPLEIKNEIFTAKDSDRDQILVSDPTNCTMIATSSKSAIRLYNPEKNLSLEASLDEISKHVIQSRNKVWSIFQ